MRSEGVTLGPLKKGRKGQSLLGHLAQLIWGPLAEGNREQWWRKGFLERSADGEREPEAVTSKSVPDSLFTLKASVKGLGLATMGNPGITGDNDTDKFTENSYTKVAGGAFSATVLVAGRWIRCSASPAGLNRDKET